MLPIDKLESFVRRAEELDRLLCDPEVTNDSGRYRRLSKERAGLESLVTVYGEFKKLTKQLEEDRAALDDPELHDLVAEEIPGLEAQLATLSRELTFMLLPTELAGVMAVLCGIIDKLEFRNHGEDKDKSLCIEHQGNCVFLKILHARRAVAVPITPEDAMRMAALTLRQLRLNHFGLGGQEVLALVRSVYSPLKTAANARRQA